jgi:hypothetical protein
MWGSFPRAFRKAVRPYIKNQRVVDLGCGDCERADILLGMNPEAIVGVDQDPPCKTSVLTIMGYFDQVFEKVLEFKPTVAHVAWPSNHYSPGLVPLLEMVPTVIYVGSNVGGTACGGSDLWEYVTTRKVLLYLPERRNSLIVYGPVTGTRALTHEELAAKGSDMVEFDPSPYP